MACLVHEFAMAWGLVWSLLHVLLLILNLLWCGWITGFSFFTPHFILWVGSCLGMCPSSFSSASIFLHFWFVGRPMFLPRHSIAPAMLPLDLCLLGLFWACHVLFSYSIHIVQCFCLVNPHTILGFLDPLYSFGHPWPTLFLWASLAHSILTFPWAFVTFFGLPWPNYHILYFRGLLAFVPTPFANSYLLGSSDPFLLTFYFL